MYYDWRPYVSVAERRRNAEREMQRLRRKGHPVSPVVIEGRAIAQTFWGKAWCDNLERYSDYANRLPRGRTYVRNGSVVDLQLAPGKVTAVVSGSELYQVAIKVAPVPKTRWTAICGDCAGAIDSLVELLQGRFSKGVMERICQQKVGLFPSPSEIELSCSCPDWASMCKHLAAVLYGVGARLDQQPELLFKLRQVDETDLIAKAGSGLPLAKAGPSADRVLGGEGLSELFGLELEGPGQPEERAGQGNLAPGAPAAKGSAPSRVAGRKTKGGGRGRAAQGARAKLSKPGKKRRRPGARAAGGRPRARR